MHCGILPIVTLVVRHNKDETQYYFWPRTGSFRETPATIAQWRLVVLPFPRGNRSGTHSVFTLQSNVQ